LLAKMGYKPGMGIGKKGENKWLEVTRFMCTSVAMYMLVL
jgi:hypothetical protein